MRHLLTCIALLGAGCSSLVRAALCHSEPVRPDPTYAIGKALPRPLGAVKGDEVAWVEKAESEHCPDVPTHYVRRIEMFFRNAPERHAFAAVVAMQLQAAGWETSEPRWLPDGPESIHLSAQRGRIELTFALQGTHASWLVVSPAEPLGATARTTGAGPNPT